MDLERRRELRRLRRCSAYSNFLTSRVTNPFVHHGRHFGRTIHALCNVKQLLSNGLLRLGNTEAENRDLTSESVSFRRFLPAAQ
jgi:hypothetical protein